MYAPQIVYATLQGRFPQRLGEDGSGQRLVLPPSDYGDANIKFEFYSTDGSNTPIIPTTITQAIYRPDNTTTINLTINVDMSITFPASLPPNGTCVIVFNTTTGTYITYPFKVARPAMT